MTSINPPWDARFGFRRHRRHHHAHPPFAGDAATMAADQHDPHDDGPHQRRGRGGRRGRPHGGPRFGPDFGFPPPPRGFGRGRGRRTSRGDIRLAVLALVAEQPRHGYEIIQEIAERTGGEWRPSPGSVYPTLSQLQDEGLVTVEKAAGRRVVELTDAGTSYVEEHRAELDAVWASVDTPGDEGPIALWEQLGQLHAATHQMMGAGTPEQIAAATASITEARKTIYRLLAE